jgi:DNA polymerase III epsilon subunit-like protein
MSAGTENGTVYFCVDIETSGSVPYFYNMVSLGAVVVRPQEGRLAPGADFYVEILPDFDGFDPEAMAIHKLTLEHLQRNGVDSKQAMQRLSDWVHAQLGPRDRPVFVGHNAPFDWSFVNFYYRYVGLPNPFGYKALDTKALAMGKLGLSWWHSNKEVLEQRLPGLRPPPPELVHRADHDARYQADILCALLNPR